MTKIALYRDWLLEEGHRAGGIGPCELTRLEQRHLADSLAFTAGLPARPSEVWDLGSGVGLPGIPLAIAFPEAEFTLIDRSGRRTDLLRRAVRILNLENCQVLQGDIADLTGRVPAIVSRASMPPAALAPVVGAHLEPGGVAVVGGSWHNRPEHEGWQTLEIPAEVLDQPVWLLIMRRA
jgi:16S rRNA (guanine527-N7)-methyltransferase